MSIESKAQETKLDSLWHQAECFLEQQNYKLAAEAYQSLIQVEKQEKDRQEYLELALNQLGYCLFQMGRYDEASERFEESLAIARVLGQAKNIAVRLNNIGAIYAETAHLDKVIDLFQGALELAEKFGLDEEVARLHNNIGETLNRKGDSVKARERFEKALEMQTARGNKAGCAVTHSNMGFLNYANKNLPGAANHFQQAIDLLEQLRLTAQADARRDYLASQIDTYRMLAETFALSQDIEGVIHVSEQSRARVLAEQLSTNMTELRFSLKEIQQNLSRKTAILVYANVGIGLPMIQILIKKDNIAMARVPDFEVLDHVYEDQKPALKPHMERQRNVKPLFGNTSAHRELFPTDLAGLISYYRKLLSEYRKEPLAENASQFAYIQNLVEEALSNGQHLTDVYDYLGLSQWQDLPGTLVEVTELKKVVGDAVIFTGQEASKTKLRKLSEAGELAQYRVIHFATHGVVVPELPVLSAIVLSEVSLVQAVTYGYLNLNDVTKLKLTADFVNLSACETGLGKLYSGEGVLGLPQAFFIAGANGLSVSLWQVADQSTATLMVRMYELAIQKKESYTHALAKVKRQFINGDFGLTYQAPFHWAAFVYYGK